MPRLANGFQTALVLSLSPPPASKPHPNHCKRGVMEEGILQGKCGVRLKARPEEVDGALWREEERDRQRDKMKGFRGGYRERKGR